MGQFCQPLLESHPIWKTRGDALTHKEFWSSRAFRGLMDHSVPFQSHQPERTFASTTPPDLLPHLPGQQGPHPASVPDHVLPATRWQVCPCTRFRRWRLKSTTGTQAGTTQSVQPPEAVNLPPSPGLPTIKSPSSFSDWHGIRPTRKRSKNCNPKRIAMIILSKSQQILREPTNRLLTVVHATFNLWLPKRLSPGHTCHASHSLPSFFSTTRRRLTRGRFLFKPWRGTRVHG